MLFILQKWTQKFRETMCVRRRERKGRGRRRRRRESKMVTRCEWCYDYHDFLLDSLWGYFNDPSQKPN